MKYWLDFGDNMDQEFYTNTDAAVNMVHIPPSVMFGWMVLLLIGAFLLAQTVNLIISVFDKEED